MLNADRKIHAQRTALKYHTRPKYMDADYYNHPVVKKMYPRK